MNSQQLDSHVANLLVVDDTPDNLRLLSTMLSDKGYKVRGVINGEMALKAAGSTPPDLILLDITMPQMNGYEVCRRLKSDPKTQNLPVVMCSSKSEEIDRYWGMKQGADAYIAKPFHPQELVGTIKQLLRG